MLLGIPFAGCTTTVVNPPTPENTSDGGTPEQPAEDASTEPPPASMAPEDRCLDGQDMDAPDVDISKCPPIPNAPAVVVYEKIRFNLGAWEIGTTSTGDTYKYGSLSSADTDPRTLKYDTGSAPVNKENLECWAKGYYRLRRYLQKPPAEYMALYNAKFQVRFFQFQTDLRNGPTGYKKISSFEDHLVKWVTVVNAQGQCEQPTLTKFRDYAKAELKRRNLPIPEATQ
jgi:hypothetical protein